MKQNKVPQGRRGRHSGSRPGRASPQPRNPSDLLERLHLGEVLSLSRGNGFHSIVEAMRRRAAKLAAAEA